MAGARRGLMREAALGWTGVACATHARTWTKKKRTRERLPMPRRQACRWLVPHVAAPARQRRRGR
eukprot:scaffold14163_cov115-Isochrysis_galbana.AAC.8